MNIELRTPTPADLQEFNENAERPYFAADSCILDGGAVELTLGGVTIAGIFHDYDAYELALGVLDMETPERPEGGTMEFWTPEQLQEELNEEELEYSIWSALTALHALRSRQEGAVEAYKTKLAQVLAENPLAPQNATQSFVAVPHDFMSREPKFLDPVGLLTEEEVAELFDVKGQVA